MTSGISAGGFGLAHIRPEGGAMHPDDTHWAETPTGAAYERQLRAFVEQNGAEITRQMYCSEPELLEQIIADVRSR